MQQETIIFNSLPKNADELRAMPEAALASPFATAALTAAAFCAYGENPAACIEMLNVLMGPAPLSPRDIQFLRDRLAGEAYKPFSYFAGATPQNNYEPARPYTVTVTTNPYSYQNAGYARLFIASGGADSPRPLSLRQKPSTGQWFLNEYSSLLLSIRIPAAADPWA